MKIPEKIQILGVEIPTVWDDKLCDDKEVYARADFHQGIIIMQKKTLGVERTDDQIFQAYLHEVQHWIYRILCYPADRDDEDKVDRMAHTWMQVIKQIVEVSHELH
jgi:hypothetical protein